MSRKKSNGWGAFWLGFFLVVILPKILAGRSLRHTEKEWFFRIVIVIILLCPFWLAIIGLAFEEEPPPKPSNPIEEFFFHKTF